MVLLTKPAADRQVAEHLLKGLKNGECVYQSDRQVLVKKKMSASMSKIRLSQFNEQPQKTPATILTEKKNLSPKDVTEARKIWTKDQKGS